MEIHENITFKQCCSAISKAKCTGQPVVVWHDDDYDCVRYMSLSDYEDDIEQGGFVSETSVLVIIDESGCAI